MGKRVDITGERYGMLTAISPTTQRTKGGGVYWRFKCDCGNEKCIPAKSVRSGLIKSCGCLAKPHGEAGTRLHNIWVDMRQRCKDKKNKHYGAKGITVCPEWELYINFREWAMNNGYTDDLSIDRIDGNKGYSPDNCRWLKPTGQNRNLSSNRMIRMDGLVKPLSEWCEMLGIKPYTVQNWSKRKNLPIDADLLRMVKAAQA